MATNDLALFDRRCRVTIAAPSDDPEDFTSPMTQVIEIDGGATDNKAIIGLRVKFSIKKTLKKEPNAGEVVVTNLSPSRRKTLQQKGVLLRLEAGYRETGITQLSSGDVRAVDHVRDGANWNTTFKLGDGERAWQFARVYESFKEGTSVADVLRAAVAGLGVGAGNLEKQLAGISKQFKTGYAISGSAARAIDKLVTGIGYTWSVQDGEFQLLPKDGKLDLPIAVVSPTSGLVGSPEMGTPSKKGGTALVKVKSLLIPMKPGQVVKLESERYDGFVKVESCEFEGDTHGEEWFTTMNASILK